MEEPKLLNYTIDEYFEIEMFYFKKTFEKWKEEYDLKLDSITFLNDEYHPDTCHINLLGKNGEKIIYSIRMVHKCCHTNQYGIDWVEERFDEEKVKQRIEEIIND